MYLYVVVYLKFTIRVVLRVGKTDRFGYPIFYIFFNNIYKLYLYNIYHPGWYTFPA